MANKSRNSVLQIAFDQDFDYYNEIKKLKTYHQDCLKVLNTIEENNMEVVKKKIEEGEIILPTRPKTGLQKLIKLERKTTENNPTSLHKYLAKKLVCDINVVETNMPSKKDKEGIYTFLCSYNNTLEKFKAKHFYMYAAFGYYFEVYRNYFIVEKPEESWAVFLKQNFKISENYFFKLQRVGQLVSDFPKLKVLSLTFVEFVKILKKVKEMLTVEEYGKYWKQV